MAKLFIFLFMIMLFVGGCLQSDNFNDGILDPVWSIETTPAGIINPIESGMDEIGGYLFVDVGSDYLTTIRQSPSELPAISDYSVELSLIPNPIIVPDINVNIEITVVFESGSYQKFSIVNQYYVYSDASIEGNLIQSNEWYIDPYQLFKIKFTRVSGVLSVFYTYNGSLIELPYTEENPFCNESVSDFNINIQSGPLSGSVSKMLIDEFIVNGVRMRDKAEIFLSESNITKTLQIDSNLK